VAISRKDRIRTERRAKRIRGAQQRGVLPRVSVFRSLKNIYGQVIDDANHVTLASCESKQLTNVKGDKKAVAHAVGKELAQRAKAKGVDQVIFDRGSYKYHGRVKAFADGLREGGLQV
jgi:large subunit ribosomal protein L18